MQTRTKKLYITRHGQVIVWKNYGDAQFPAGDPPLSEDGRKQAAYLGAYLKSIGFTGNVYSSPYARALETAQIVCDHTGSKLIPFAPMREIVKKAENIKDFVGLTIDEIKEKYPAVPKDAQLSYPWWTTYKEERDDVIGRTKAGIDSLPDEEALLVGHGASVGGACAALEIPPVGGDVYNCCLSVYDPLQKENCRYLDYGYLPYELRSFNSVIKSKEDLTLLQPLLEQELDISLDPNATTLLHISNTPSFAYPYIEKIIRKVRPDVIVHTGDFVDEEKAGQVASALDTYIQGLESFSKILAASGAKKIYAVAGNNDIQSLLQEKLPFAEILSPNQVVEIGGISCALCHTAQERNTDAKWVFCGRSKGAETTNDADLFCTANGYRVIQLPAKKVDVLPVPQEYVNMRML